MPLIAEYLLHLGQHSNAHKAFQQNPSNAMSCFGLSQEQQDVITSGDEQRLGSAIQQEFSACASGFAPSMTTKFPGT